MPQRPNLLVILADDMGFPTSARLGAIQYFSLGGHD